MGGFNPMRWDCSVKGCFNTKQRPKIEVFHDCFPGRISFGDIDAIVEISGRGLLLEWKSAPMVISGGQKIMHERLTAGGMLSVYCVAGNAETMEITHKGLFYNGKWRGWQPSDLTDLKNSIRSWVKWAQSSQAGVKAA
jgi:hypothetical protein